MSIEELKKRFLVDEDTVKAGLECLLTKALQLCVVDKKGVVHIKEPKMSGPNKFKLVLAARYLASQLDPSVPAAVTIAEITRSTGLPNGQVRARAKESVDNRFAESPRAGVYQALPHKIEPFLNSLDARDLKK
jgi:hypothetical protein